MGLDHENLAFSFVASYSMNPLWIPSQDFIINVSKP